VKYVASAGSLQGTHNFAEEPARYYGSEPSLQETEENGCVKFPTAQLSEFTVS